ncbi:MAG: glycosyltransferase family 2 protein [Candidatus Omnitrophica bacterium]|nr:glycosyltransferase family 2 protein [Candidatus Omnitrophota bacterium]
MTSTSSPSQRPAPEETPPRAGAQRLVDIVIPVWNQPERTSRCLRLILQSTREPVRLILIDNGSDPPTREALEEFRATSPVPVRLIRNDVNLGFVKGVNQGIREATAPWICLLNNDTIVAPGWLTELIRVAEENPAIGLLNPTSNSLGFDLGSQSAESYAQGLKGFSGSWSELSTALGFCLFSRRSLYDEIGPLDESFGMGYFEDDDLSRRVRKAGYRCARARAAYVFHEEKASFRHLPGTEKAFQENRARYEEKWGRRLRILWVLSDSSLKEDPSLPRTARELVSDGHWITFVSSDPRIPPELQGLAQVSVRAASRCWRQKALWRLIAKRRKPWRLAVSDDERWSRWARGLRFLHRAEVLDRPRSEEILKRCSELSICR